MADTVIGGAGQGIFLVQKTNGRTVVQGLNETRQKFLDMGGDRNLFEKWMKEAAQVAAREATARAPRIEGNLALSVRGFASKKMQIKSRTTGKVTDRMVFGGVITAGSARDRNTESAGGVIDTVTTGVQYARAVSLGTYHNAGTRSKVGNRVWRTTVRGKGNPFMVKARESKKSYMVTLLNFKLTQYIKQKGFQTNGL
jgi:hypothetical protein